MTTLTALVLGGGGVAGIAWETGVLRGIADKSPAAAQALLDSDVLVGTSAGSAVAAQIGSGLSIDDLFARQVRETSAEIDPGLGVAEMADLGVRRVSVGGALARVAWGAMLAAAERIKAGSFEDLAGAARGDQLNGVFGGFA